MEIQKILATFGIEQTNNGASTGSEWIQTKGEKIDRDLESVTDAIGAYVNSYMQVKSKEFKNLFDYDPSSISTIPTPNRGNNG